MVAICGVVALEEIGVFLCSIAGFWRYVCEVGEGMEVDKI